MIVTATTRTFTVALAVVCLAVVSLIAAVALELRSAAASRRVGTPAPAVTWIQIGAWSGRAARAQRRPSPLLALAGAFDGWHGRHAEAVIRLIDGLGTDLRYLHNGALRESRVYRDDAQLQATAAAKRNDLLAKGWVDPGSLAWGR